MMIIVGKEYLVDAIKIDQITICRITFLPNSQFVQSNFEMIDN